MLRPNIKWTKTRMSGMIGIIIMIIILNWISTMSIGWTDKQKTLITPLINFP